MVPQTIVKYVCRSSAGPPGAGPLLQPPCAVTILKHMRRPSHTRPRHPQDLRQSALGPREVCAAWRREGAPPIRGVAHKLQPTQQCHRELADHGPQAEEFAPWQVEVQRVCTKGPDTKQEHVADGQATLLGLKECRLLRPTASRLIDPIGRLRLHSRVGGCAPHGTSASGRL